MDKLMKREGNISGEQELIRLGFKKHPEWDFKETGTESFRLEAVKNTYRAHVDKNNGPIYTKLGVVINESGIVDRWRDCCSRGSVERKIFLLESEVQDGK